jgi:hypothetical protein
LYVATIASRYFKNRSDVAHRMHMRKWPAAQMTFVAA